MHVRAHQNRRVMSSILGEGLEVACFATSLGWVYTSKKKIHFVDYLYCLYIIYVYKSLAQSFDEPVDHGRSCLF